MRHHHTLSRSHLRETARATSKPSARQCLASWWTPLACLALCAALLAGCNDDAGTEEEGDTVMDIGGEDTRIADTGQPDSGVDMSAEDSSGTDADDASDAESDAGDTGGADVADVADADTADVTDGGDSVDAVDAADMGTDTGNLMNLLCMFDGNMTQMQGDDCGCDADCDMNAPLCRRDFRDDLMGPSYCTVECTSDFNCPEGFGCVEELGVIPGIDPFCKRCASPTSGALGEGEACLCDRDCGVTQSGGFPRTMGCYEGTCAISPCNESLLPCPSGSQCQTTVEFPLGVCVPCLHTTPQPAGTACQCETDCAGGLDCLAGECRKPCSSDADCAGSEECQEQVDGSSWCNEPDFCVGLGAGQLGTPCTCNADCAASAPVCLNQNVAGFDAAFCTRRPCDRSDPAACSGAIAGQYSCCEIPLVMPSTCLPDVMVNQLGGLAFCGP